MANVLTQRQRKEGPQLQHFYVYICFLQVNGNRTLMTLVWFSILMKSEI